MTEPTRPADPIRTHLSLPLSELLGWDRARIQGLLEMPADDSLGDYALPCFQLARELRRAPPAIAFDLAARFPADDLVDSVSAAGGYVNFRLRAGELARRVLGPILSGGADHAAGGAGGTYVIDFSSPNIAKPFHVGHLRSTILGHSLGRILRYLGSTVVGINHLGDWGTQFGFLMMAYRKWGDEARLTADPIGHLVELYVRGNQEAGEDPSLREEARTLFKALEDGDPECRELWARFRELSLVNFRKVYDMLGVTFDAETGESFFEDRMEDAIARLRSKGLAVESEGALVVPLDEEGLPSFLLRKSDGATLYSTRDLAAVFYRLETYRPTRLVYVVGSPQKLHFQQLAATLRRYDPALADLVVHVDFGQYRLKSGKMSSRAGQAVELSDVIDEAVTRARAIIEEKNPDLDDKEAVARQVALAGILFADLSTDRVRDVLFDMERVIRFDGDTGPYLQYCHVRTRGILRKAGDSPGPDVDVSLLATPAERRLCLLLNGFRGALEKAAYDYRPSHLANYLLDVGRGLSRFLEEAPVLRAEPAMRDARLGLTVATAHVISTGLHLLGIEVPERM